MALQRKLATETKILDATQNLALLNASSSSTLRTHIALIDFWARDIRTQSKRREDGARRVQEHDANVTQRLLEHRVGMLVTVLAIAWETMGLAQFVKGWQFSWQGCRQRKPLYMMPAT